MKNSPKLSSKKISNISILKTKKRTEIENELFDDVLDIINEKDVGKLTGFVVVGIYKEGYNARSHVPDEMSDRLYKSYVDSIIDEHVFIERYEEQEEEY